MKVRIVLIIFVFIHGSDRLYSQFENNQTLDSIWKSHWADYMSALKNSDFINCDSIFKNWVIKCRQEQKEIWIYKGYKHLMNHLESLDELRDPDIKKMITQLEELSKEIHEPARSLVYQLIGNYYLLIGERLGHQGNIQVNDTDEAKYNLDGNSLQALVNKADGYYLRSLNNKSLDSISVSSYSEALELSSYCDQSFYEFLLKNAIDYFERRIPILENENFENLLHALEHFEFNLFNTDSSNLKNLFCLHTSKYFITKKDSLNYFKIIDLYLKSEIKLIHCFALPFELNIVNQTYLKQIYRASKYFEKSQYSYFWVNRILELEILKYLENKNKVHCSEKLGMELKRIDSMLVQAELKYPYLQFDFCRDIINNEKFTSEFELTIKSKLPLKQPIRFLLKSRNLKSIQFSIYRIYDKDTVLFKVFSSKEFSFYHRTLYDSVSKVEIISWDMNITGVENGLWNCIDVSGPQLPSGMYILKAFFQDGLNVSDHTSGYQFFQVSDLETIQFQNWPDSDLLYVADRISGEPRDSVKVHIYKIFDGEENFVRDTVVYTDKNGLVQIPLKNEVYWNSISCLEEKRSSKYVFFISYNGDTLWNFEPSLFKGDELHTEEPIHLCQVFFDKAYYHPGDTVRYLVYGNFKKPDGIWKSLSTCTIGSVIYLPNPIEQYNVSNLMFDSSGLSNGECILPVDVQEGQARLYIGEQEFLFSIYSKEPRLNKVIIDSVHSNVSNFRILNLKGRVKNLNLDFAKDQNLSVLIYRQVQYTECHRFNFAEEIARYEIITDSTGYFSIDDYWNFKIADHSESTRINYFAMIKICDKAGNIEYFKYNFKNHNLNDIIVNNLDEFYNKPKSKELKFELTKAQSEGVKVFYEINIIGFPNQEILQNELDKFFDTGYYLFEIRKGLISRSEFQLCGFDRTEFSYPRMQYSSNNGRLRLDDKFWKKLKIYPALLIFVKIKVRGETPIWRTYFVNISDHGKDEFVMDYNPVQFLKLFVGDTVRLNSDIQILTHKVLIARRFSMGRYESEVLMNRDENKNIYIIQSEDIGKLFLNQIAIYGNIQRVYSWKIEVYPKLSRLPYIVKPELSRIRNKCRECCWTDGNENIIKCETMFRIIYSMDQFIPDIVLDNWHWNYSHFPQERNFIQGFNGNNIIHAVKEYTRDRRPYHIDTCLFSLSKDTHPYRFPFEYYYGGINEISFEDLIWFHNKIIVQEYVDTAFYPQAIKFSKEH